MSDDDPATRMQRAVRQIRREGYKVAVVYAVIDAAAVALLGNLLVQVLPVPFVPDQVALPDAIVPAFEAVGITLADPAVTGASLVAVAAGIATAVLEVAIRVRRPLVEQFEAANPEVREALRTARDAVEDGLQTQIARSLYEDVLTRLRETSSVGLVNLRRVVLTLALVVGLSLVSLQVAVVGFTLTGPGDAGPGDRPGPSSEYTGLQDGDAILGEPTDVSAGDEELEATIGTSGEGSGNASDVPRAYETGGFVVDGAVESQQAGFTGDEQLEDAALIREYNLRIREETDD